MCSFNGSLLILKILLIVLWILYSLTIWTFLIFKFNEKFQCFTFHRWIEPVLKSSNHFKKQFLNRNSSVKVEVEAKHSIISILDINLPQIVCQRKCSQIRQKSAIYRKLAVSHFSDDAQKCEWHRVLEFGQIACGL